MHVRARFSQQPSSPNRLSKVPGAVGGKPSIQDFGVAASTPSGQASKLSPPPCYLVSSVHENVYEVLFLKAARCPLLHASRCQGWIGVAGPRLCAAKSAAESIPSPCDDAPNYDWWRGGVALLWNGLHTSLGLVERGRCQVPPPLWLTFPSMDPLCWRGSPYTSVVVRLS